MGRQASEETAAKTNELRSVVEPLRLGHGLLSREQFVRALMNRELEIWRLPHNAYALISWSDSEHGPCCHVATVCGTDETASAQVIDDCLKALEVVARENGARMLISVGRSAYKRAALANGYTVEPGILMKKVFRND